MLASRFKFLVFFELFCLIVHRSIASSALRSRFCLARFATFVSKFLFFMVSSLHFCAIFLYLAAALLRRFTLFGAYDTEAGMGVEIGVGDSDDGMHS